MQENKICSVINMALLVFYIVLIHDHNLENVKIPQLQFNCLSHNLIIFLKHK